jgi:flagellar motor switch protein FliN/FliY
MTPLAQIGHLADIPVYIDVELARKAMTVDEILALDEGSVIKMDRSAGENIDILVGGALLGSGEIVIIEETVGVRITDFNEED